MEKELEEILHNGLDELVRAGVDRKHPFRFVGFSTVSPEGIPDARTVVLRKFKKQNKQLSVYTDLRSQKVEHLRKQPLATLLFWHPRKRWQIKVLAQFSIDSDAPELFEQQPEAGQLSYNSTLPPSQEVDELRLAHEVKDRLSAKDFCLLLGEIKSLEVLQLKDKHHLRAKFSFEDGNLIKSTWLVP